MKIYQTLSLVFALVVTLAWSGCGKDDKNPDYIAEANCTSVDASTNTYALAIKAIMDNSCALGGCHDAGTKSDGVDLSDYAGTKKAFESQDLLCAVNHGNGCQPMPKGGSKLSSDVLNRLACWARNGYAQ